VKFFVNTRDATITLKDTGIQLQNIGASE